MWKVESACNATSRSRTTAATAGADMPSSLITKTRRVSTICACAGVTKKQTPTVKQKRRLRSCLDTDIEHLLQNLLLPTSLTSVEDPGEGRQLGFSNYGRDTVKIDRCGVLSKDITRRAKMPYEWFPSRSAAKLQPRLQLSYALLMLGRLQGMFCVQRCFSASLVMLIATILLSGPACGQTVSTGALIGITLDPSGAVLPGVSIQLSNPETKETEFTTSDKEGRFSFALLSPGTYELRASKTNFDALHLANINVSVTETLRLELRLRLAEVVGNVQVSYEPLMVQSDNSALGRLVNEEAVGHLPLVTRNFAQIAGLAPGVVVGVYNATELGTGGTALSQISKSNDGLYVHGSRSYGNNWQIEGISVTDLQGSGASSGGIPTPNPDTILEFKVQTGLYDAAYGRSGGANVSVITKMGSNTYHGTAFGFFRNDVLNANDFFLNRTGQPRPTLRQNQMGFNVGGPIKREKFLFFGAYQKTHQLTGLALGQARIACSAALSSPPIGNDRTPAALGRLFGGMTGALGGAAIRTDGSNINPVALAILNFKLPDGTFLIPTPQTVDPSRAFESQGFSSFTKPCNFDENQFLTNFDYLRSSKTKIAARFFFARDSEVVTVPGNAFNSLANIPGSPSPADSDFRVLSLTHTHILGNTSLNEARIGYVYNKTHTRANPPLKWSDVVVAEGEMSEANELPSLKILGSVSFNSAFPQTHTQDSFVGDDTLSFVYAAHAIRTGGSLSRLQDDHDVEGVGSFVEFLSWPDFLLGNSAAGNGSETFSNVFASVDLFGLFNREYRVWEGSAFVQDDYRIRKSLTLNIGLRYERLGQFGDNLGRNSSFDISKADANPPPNGSLDGYIVASNFPGTPPPGVTRVDNTLGNYGNGQNTFAPRIGFAWQALPQSSRLVLRGGYGLYYSRTAGQAFYQSVFGAPFSEFRLNGGAANANATFEAPFAQPFPTPDSFPLFPVYSPTTATTIYTVAPNVRPALIQQYSLNVQTELHDGWLLEVGYVGTRGIHLVRQRSLNQALSASASNPIRGEATNTIANVPLRVPILGIPPDSLLEMESEGSSWYNGLEASLTKRLSHGLQFLASYTFSKTLDTDGADINSTSSGNALTLGDQNSPGQRWGRASFDRTHRFVFSGTWILPSPSSGAPRAVLGGWDLAAIITIQTGSALTIAHTNANNVFGISEDRAQLSGNCTKSQIVTGGAISSKLNKYFNSSCFTTPLVVGADDIGTAFGNSGTGIVNGPGQANLDLALSKTVPLSWPAERSNLQFRAEFFNAFNHPQFANPDTNFASPTFGVISSTAVSARVGQLALRINF